MKLAKVLVVVSVIILIGGISVAQTAPNFENGFKPWGSYDGSHLDTVNLMNGNVMLHAPLVPSIPQRGALGVSNTLYASSKDWQVVCRPNAGCDWDKGGGGVLIQRSPDLSVHRSMTKSVFADGITYSASGYTVLTADGATHQLLAVASSTDSNGVVTQYDSIDVSGLHVQLMNGDSNGIYTTAVVTDRQGTQYQGNFGAYQQCTRFAHVNELPLPDTAQHPPYIDDAPTGDQNCSQTAHASLVTDGDGNQMSMHTPTNTNPSVDTLGRSFPLGVVPGSPGTTTDYSGCVTTHTITSAIVGIYVAPDGSTQQIKLCSADIAINTGFSVGGVREAISGTQNNAGIVDFTAVVSVVLGDGSRWTFDYDNYGELIYIGLPTGGSISYTWTTVGFGSCPNNNTPVSRAVATRTLNDGQGHTSQWTYAWGTFSGTSLTNKVTDPLGNDTVHVFTALDGSAGCSLYETRTVEYQGLSNANQPLSRVDTTFSSALLAPDATPGSVIGNVFATDILTTTYPSGRVKKVHKDPDPGLGAGLPIFGNPIRELDYDWGEGAPGPLLKETDTTYQWQANSAYLTAHMVDLPASVIIKDGSGNRVAETDYAYDESGPGNLTSASVSTQHVSPPASVRGNQTTVSHWLNTNNTWISSHTKWYDTGVVYQQIDPLGHTTTHSYDPAYAGAYSTQTCTPQTGTFNHCVSGTYDFNTGVLTSFTNENATTQASGNTPGDSGHTSTYVYDSMWRLISGQAPPDPDNGNARATNTFAFSSPNVFPLTLTRQKSITASINASGTTIFDGLGRPITTQHATPNGTVYVDTVYDAAGQVASVSNPYFSTADATYGLTLNQYDGAGRITQVQKPDGSISTVSYTDNCTIAMDETGKQRRSCTDGLGRLTSVDEPGDPNAGASTVVSGGGTAATGSVTISGTEQSVNSPPSGGGGTRCPPRVICDGGSGGGGYSTIYDFGTVSINVAGHVYTVPYNSDGTTTGIATSLAAAINSDTYGPVTATGSGPTVYLSSRATGSQVSYSLSVSWTWDTTDFASPSFTETTPGSVSGGNDGPPVFGGHAYTTLYSYDPLGNLLQVTQQGGTTTQSNWRVRTFTYNSLSQLLTANNPESGTITYGYDPDGELIAQTDARGYPINFTYDAGHRILTKNYTDGTFGAGYTYDQSGVWGTPGNNAIGRLVLAYDGVHAATLYSYNIAGQVKQQWDCPPSAWVNGGCPSVTASYNLGGDLTQLNYPDGRVVANSYNSADQLDQVQVGGTSYWSVNDANFYPNGTPKLATLGNGVTESTVLNKRLQTQEDTVASSVISTTPLADHTYNFGTQNNGNILSVTDNVGSAFSQSFTYDQLNRLATANESRWGLSFTYDPWGNRLQQSLTAGFAGQSQLTIDANNRIHGNCTTDNPYCYDAAGNLLYDTVHHYTFDGASRISQVDSGATKYTYDPVVGRVRKDTGSNYTEYFYFGGSVIAEQDQAGHWTDYIYAGGKRIAKADLFDTRLHVSATTCNGCTGAYEVMNFSNIGDLNGHVIQAGEKLFVRQLIPTGMSGGVGFCFTDATCMVWYPAVVDQNGLLASWAAGTGSWQYRRIDLSPIAGKTINNAYMENSAKADGQPWNVYYDDIVVQWADGTVHPLYTRESSLATFQYGTGQTNPTTVVETSTASGDVSNPAQTTYYYHGDQIGSSRLMTSGSGWPVWQGTFLPYGEEYNAQIGTNHYKFTGKERDDESGLDYFGARYYGNSLGRWLSPDWATHPVSVPYAEFGDPQSLNLYTYVRNNPISHADADGHCWPYCELIAHIAEYVAAHTSYVGIGIKHTRDTYNAAARQATAITGRDADKVIARNQGPILGRVLAEKAANDPARIAARAAKSDAQLLKSITRTNPEADAAAARYGVVGKAAAALTIGIAAYNVYKAPPGEKLSTVGKEGLGIGGAVAGGEGGAVAGTFVAPGPGTVIGGILGSIVGGTGARHLFDSQPETCCTFIERKRLHSESEGNRK